MSGCQDTLTTQLFHCTFFWGVQNSIKQHFHVTLFQPSAYEISSFFQISEGIWITFLLKRAYKVGPFLGNCLLLRRWYLSPFLLLPPETETIAHIRRSSQKWNTLFEGGSVFRFFSFLVATLNCKLAYFGIEKFSQWPCRRYLFIGCHI